MRGAAFALCALLLCTAQAMHPCFPPECDFCLSTEVREAPGVGFDLTTGYA
jgi:hypothetical protein